MSKLQSGIIDMISDIEVGQGINLYFRFAYENVPSDELPVYYELYQPLEIITDLSDVTITEGDDATFAIEASGEELSYAWFFQLADGSVKPISDATDNALTLTDVSYESNDAKVYCVVISIHGEQAESRHATLTVEPKQLVITSDLSDVSVTEGGIDHP